MEKEFVSYSEALALKELGFDEPCLAQYRKYDIGDATLDMGFSKNQIIMQFHKLSKFCSAPTFSQAFRWFREKYNLLYTIHCNNKGYFATITEKVNGITPCIFSSEIFKSYEETELECLKKLIELVKNK